MRVSVWLGYVAAEEMHIDCASSQHSWDSKINATKQTPTYIHSHTHKINGIFWFRTREPIFGEHEMRLADACLLRQELRLFCDSNPIFLFDIHQTFKTHLIVHRLCRFCGGCCCCYWAWVSVCARHFFPWEIFNQKHADRFYGVFSHSILVPSRKTVVVAHGQKRIHHHLRTFAFLATQAIARWNCNNKSTHSPSTSLVMWYQYFVDAFIHLLHVPSVGWFDDKTNWKRFKIRKLKTKTKKLEIRQQDTQISLQKKIYLKMGINETFGNEIRQKQTNWFESLDQPSTPVRK